MTSLSSACAARSTSGSRVLVTKPRNVTQPLPTVPKYRLRSGGIGYKNCPTRKNPYRSIQCKAAKEEDDDLSFINEPNWFLDEKKREIAKSKLAEADDPVAQFFEIAGFKGGAGKKIMYGVQQVDVDPLSFPSDEEQEQRRREAAESLTNIDNEERQRRDQLGRLILGATAVVALGLYGSGQPWYVRSLMFFPFSTGAGFYLSGQTGLCNIAQSGAWDVDGTGMQKIEDSNIAQKIRDKVNLFNLQTLVGTLAVTGVYAALPVFWK